MKLSPGVVKVFYFMGGLVVGAAGSLVFIRKYYRQKAEDEIASVEKAFTEKINELEGEKDFALDAAEKALLGANDYNREDPGASSLIKNRSTLDGMLKAKKAERVDYVQYSKDSDGYVEKNSKESIEADDHPRDDGEEGEYSDMNDGVTEAIMEIGNGRDNLKEPYEIDYREYGSLPSYEFKELYFYKGDGTLVETEDESEDIIDNPEYLVGDVLKSSGFDKNDEKTIYVRNEYISCDFEIMKVFGTYA